MALLGSDILNAGSSQPLIMEANGLSSGNGWLVWRDVVGVATRIVLDPFGRAPHYPPLRDALLLLVYTSP